MQDEVNQEGSEPDEVDGMKEGADSTGDVMRTQQHLVICNKEDTDHRGRV